MKPSLPAIDWFRCLAALLFTAVGVAVTALLLQLNQPIRAVHVEGDLTEAEQAAVRRVVARHLDRGLLLLGLDRLLEDVMALSWPREVELRRVWPDRLEVSVEKEAVAARWGSSDVVTTSGEIIPREGIADEALPLLKSAEGDAGRAMQLYRTLRTVMRRSELEITALREDALGIWRAELNNDITLVLGRDRLTRRLERFLVVYGEALAAQAASIEAIDARYGNGVAVRWRDAERAGAGDAVASSAAAGRGE